MPPIITSLPWLSNQPDPVQVYQRSQQLVQQMEAQRAQQAQAQAVLAQRAQEAAIQAQFQQRALALKEQEARSAVQLEADRLRQRGQALEFEQRQAELQNQFLNRPPEAVQVPGMPPGIMAGGKYYPGTRTPDLSRVAQSTPIYQDNDPSKPVIANFVWSSERGGAVVPIARGPTLEEKKLATEEKDLTTKAMRAESLDKQLLLREQSKLESQIKPGSAAYEDATEEERAQARASLAEIQRRLDAYRRIPEKPKPKAEQRAELANQLEAANPQWTPEQIMAETYRRLP